MASFYSKTLCFTSTLLFSTICFSNALNLTFEEFSATKFKTEKEVQKIFSLLSNPNMFYSSLDQAHFWAIEMDKTTRTQSMKAFLILTDKMEKAKGPRTKGQPLFKHLYATPYLIVQSRQGAKKIELALDKKNLNAPENLEKWMKNFFPFILRNKINCKEIDYITDLNALIHSKKEYCYLFKAPMYYRSPKQIEDLQHLRIERLEDWSKEDLDFFSKN